MKKHDEDEPTISIIAGAFLIVGMLLILAFFGYVIYRVMMTSGETLPLLAIGMLGDPFKTTRKMRIPFRSRVGHRERAFRKFAELILLLAVIMLLALFVARSL